MNKNLRFHLFPKKRELKDQWIAKIRRNKGDYFGAALKPGNRNRNPELKNKAKRSSSNPQKLSCIFLICKRKRTIKNVLKLLIKESPVFQCQCSCNFSFLVRAMDIRTLSIVRHISDNLILNTGKMTKTCLLVTATLLSDLHAICQSFNLGFVPLRYRTNQ